MTIWNYFADLEYQMETLSLSADDHPDMEDEESTPVSPQTPDNAVNQSVGPASESANFININPEVCTYWHFVSFLWHLPSSKVNITTRSLLPCLNYLSSCEILVCITMLLEPPPQPHI